METYVMALGVFANGETRWRRTMEDLENGEEDEHKVRKKVSNRIDERRETKSNSKISVELVPQPRRDQWNF